MTVLYINCAITSPDLSLFVTWARSAGDYLITEIESFPWRVNECHWIIPGTIDPEA